MNDTAPSQSSIMVVDDSPANLSLLGDLFREAGMKVRPFTKPSLAILGARKEPPDLFLLDINMPEMDGYELCSQLKAIPELAPIPVIFLSTLQETDDKVKAFSRGAVDYVTKQPFQWEEILARVSTHLRLRELQRAQETSNRELSENYQQLKKLEEMKDNLTNMIVHDMRSPLTVVTMALDLVNRPDSPLSEADRDNLAAAHSSATRLVDMTTLLLDISRLESGKMPLNREPQELGMLAQACLESLSVLLAPFRTEVVKCGAFHIASCDQSIVTRVLVNLVGNAAKFTPKGGSIRVHLSSQNGFERVEIKDTGPGIPEAEQALVFEKFGQGKAGRKVQGTGLGLTFCKLAVEAHGGRIGVASEAGGGACFWFTLPSESRGA